MGALWPQQLKWWPKRGPSAPAWMRLERARMPRVVSCITTSRTRTTCCVPWPKPQTKRSSTARRRSSRDSARGTDCSAGPTLSFCSKNSAVGAEAVRSPTWSPRSASATTTSASSWRQDLIDGSRVSVRGSPPCSPRENCEAVLTSTGFRRRRSPACKADSYSLRLGAILSNFDSLLTVL